MRPKDKIVIVTGGGTGMGHAIALRRDYLVATRADRRYETPSRRMGIARLAPGL